MKIYDQKINIDMDLWTEILDDPTITKKKELEILQCIFGFERFEASGGEIAKKLHYLHHAPINPIVSNFVKRLLNKYMHIDPPRESDGKIIYWHVPFLGREEKTKYPWILRPELVEALKNKYGFSEPEQTAPEEVGEGNIEFYEGKSKLISVTEYERDPKARKACLDFHGYHCKICGFNFEFFYGPFGKGIINVHHLTPISSKKKEYKIDPIKDLIPVCPNCHTMIHSRREMFTIDEIKYLVIHHGGEADRRDE